jgi:hypothetical protein
VIAIVIGLVVIGPVIFDVHVNVNPGVDLIAPRAQPVWA